MCLGINTCHLTGPGITPCPIQPHSGLPTQPNVLAHLSHFNLSHSSLQAQCPFQFPLKLPLPSSKAGGDPSPQTSPGGSLLQHTQELSECKSSLLCGYKLLKVRGWISPVSVMCPHHHPQHSALLRNCYSITTQQHRSEWREGAI